MSRKSRLLLLGAGNKSRILDSASFILSLVPGFLVTVLALRFGMRLLGVRYDVPLPGAVYMLTDPLVQPFYRWFPAPERFDYYALEWAALVAAGAVTAAALVVYVAGLLVVTYVGGRRSRQRASV